MFDPDELKEVKNRLPDYLDRFHPESITNMSAHHIKLRCPLHSEKTASFIADDKAGVWLWKCFGCQAAGTTFELHAHDHRLDPRSPENLKQAARAVGVRLSGGREPKPDERRLWVKLAEKRKLAAAEQAAVKAEGEKLTRYLDDTLEDRLDPYRHDEEWRAELWEASPFRIEDPRETPHHFIAQLFRPDDLLWMGETYESGHECHRAHFRRRDDWLKLDQLPPRIAAGTFKTDSVSRSLERIQSAPFIVLESDELIGSKPTTFAERELNKAMSYAFFLYAQGRFGLTPRAVIDTANKSLHLWFDRPPPDDLDALAKLAGGLRLDRGLLERCAAAPLRTPGCIHEKSDQRASLLYLNPILP